MPGGPLVRPGGLGVGAVRMLRSAVMNTPHEGSVHGARDSAGGSPDAGGLVGARTPCGLNWPLLGIAAALAVAGIAVAPFDVVIAEWFRSPRLPGDLGKAVMLSEAFAHGVGAAVILLAAWLLDARLHGSRGRRRLLGVVAGAFGGGLVTDLIKLMVDRVRPRALDFAAVQSTFGTFAAPGGVGGSDLHSFPSGHSAVAAGLACTLALLYPRGRWLFAGVAAMACFQRVLASAHYPSDVAWGAAIGVAVAALVGRRTAVPPLADSAETPACANLGQG